MGLTFSLALNALLFLVVVRGYFDLKEARKNDHRGKDGRYKKSD